jgi:hypothetical protein
VNQEKMVAEKRRFIRKDNQNYKSGIFEEFPKDKWPPFPPSSAPDKVLRSREFLVQVFSGEFPRLTISRTEIDKHGMWKDGISWDEMQTIKKGCGFGDCDAVEAFPKDKDLVNVANMRHLWIVPPGYATFFWRDGKEPI